MSSLNRLLLGDRTLARALPRAGVRLGPLTAHRQVAPMAQAAPAADFHQPLDVHRDLLAEVSFDAPLLFDDAADLAHIVFREVLHADVGADARFRQDVVRALAPDPVDISQPDFDALGARQINTGNTCHISCSSSESSSWELECLRVSRESI